MIRIGLIKKIRLFRKWLNETEEFEHEFPKVRDIRAFSAEIKGPWGNTCLCTEWPNGEGFDFSWYGQKGEDEKKISLHETEIDTMLECLNQMEYFNTK
jgi:hypothetical protein